LLTPQFLLIRDELMRLATRSGPLWPANLAHLKGSVAQQWASEASGEFERKGNRGYHRERRWESGKPDFGFPLFQGREAAAV
jgi:hypothetical protein